MAAMSNVIEVGRSVVREAYDVVGDVVLPKYDRAMGAVNGLEDSVRRIAGDMGTTFSAVLGLNTGDGLVYDTPSGSLPSPSYGAEDAMTSPVYKGRGLGGRGDFYRQAGGSGRETRVSERGPRRMTRRRRRAIEARTRAHQRDKPDVVGSNGGPDESSEN
jgi:hypothetical protein